MNFRELFFSSDFIFILVADFGFARKLSDSGLSTTYCGSTAYTAPEVLAAKEMVFFFIKFRLKEHKTDHVKRDHMIRKYQTHGAAA